MFSDLRIIKFHPFQICRKEQGYKKFNQPGLCCSNFVYIQVNYRALVWALTELWSVRKLKNENHKSLALKLFKFFRLPGGEIYFPGLFWVPYANEAPMPSGSISWTMLSNWVISWNFPCVVQTFKLFEKHGKYGLRCRMLIELRKWKVLPNAFWYMFRSHKLVTQMKQVNYSIF